MTVEQLISELSSMPKDMEVTIWDAEDDDYVPVVQVLWEYGHSTINLLTTHVDTIPTEFDDD